MITDASQIVSVTTDGDPGGDRWAIKHVVACLKSTLESLTEPGRYKYCECGWLTFEQHEDEFGNKRKIPVQFRERESWSGNYIINGIPHFEVHINPEFDWTTKKRSGTRFYVSCAGTDDTSIFKRNLTLEEAIDIFDAITDCYTTEELQFFWGFKYE